MHRKVNLQMVICTTVLTFRLFLNRGFKMSRDCGNRTCEVEFRLLPICQIFIDAATDRFCDYPCSLENCMIENHYWINCPVWTCEAKSTTTESPPFPTTLPPPQPALGGCSGPSCYTSLAFNGFFMMLFAVILFVFLNRKLWRQIYNSYRNPNDSNTSNSGLSNPLFDDGHDYFLNQGPIIRNAERLPLLPLHNVPPSTPNPNVPASTPTPITSFGSFRGNVAERQRAFSSVEPGRVGEATMSVGPSASVALNINETHF